MLMKRHGKKAFIFLMICCLLFSFMLSPVFAEEGPDADTEAVSPAEETAEPAEAEQQTPEQKEGSADAAGDGGSVAQEQESVKDPEPEPAVEKEAKNDGAILRSAPRASGNGFVKLVKSSGAPADVYSLSGYTLANAGYQVYTNEACTDAYKAVTADGKNAAFVTGSGGESTETLELKPGDYWLRETKSPGGHAIDQTPVPFTVTAENTADAAAAAVHLNTGDSINYTGKRDGANNTIGQTTIFAASKDGITYTGTCRQQGIALAQKGTGTVASRISNDSRIAKIVYKYGIEEGWWQGTKSHNSANSVLGINYSNTVTLQRLIETAVQINNQGEEDWKSRFGSTVNKTTINAMIKWYQNVDVSGVTVPGGFEMYHITPADGSQPLAVWTLGKSPTGPLVLNVSDRPVYGKPDFRVYKTDTKGTFTWDRIGKTTFTVKYYDVAKKADIAGAEPVRSWSFETSKKDAPGSAPAGTYWSGFDFTDNAKSGSSPFFTNEAGDRVIPIGWFTIEETVPPAGFSLIPDKYYGRVSQSAGGNAVVVIEGAADDARLKKKTVVFRDEHYKTTVHKVNASGAEMAGAQLQILQGNTVVKQTWTTAEAAAEFEDLAPGKYTLREVKAPYGCDLADDISFTVAGDKNTAVTMKNVPVTLATTAVSAATGTHIGARKTGEKITDTVHMTGLVSGRKYRLTGQLMNKRTGSAITGAAANREFTATAEAMDVTVDITFDSTVLADGDSVVVYETLYRTSGVHGETVPVELQKHHDINDAEQTVTYPGIRTKAAISGDDRVITDTVSYVNLIPGKKYVFRGWLVDTASGAKISGSDGRVELTAGKDTSGSVAMKMDASGYDSMEGYSMTAFEELYVVEKVDGTEKEIRIAEHKDRRGNASGNPQIIEIYHDLKVKKNVTGNLGDLSKVFEYTAEFTGLVPGQPYRIEGDDEKTFMADASGKASAGIKLKDGQTAVIRDLPKGAGYKVTEAASDHIAEYRMFSEDMADKGAKIIKAGDSNGADAGKALATALETVDQFDGTVVILWENNRDLATITGMSTYTGIWAAAFITVLACLAALLMIIRKRRTGIMTLAIIMVLSLGVNAFAVSGAADSDSTDYNTNRTGNSTAVRQANSSDTGTIRLGKILTVNQEGKFPNIEDFVYKITPVSAWENANVSTAKSGRALEQSEMPKPAVSTAAHHDIRGIAPDDMDNARWAALVTIGNFRNASEDNTSGIYGDKDHHYVDSDAASNTAKIDQGKRRTRVTDVSFRFTKAGYYMYKIEEAGSRPNGGNDSLGNLRKDVAGVDYDNNSYYVVFYVCNREAEADINANQYGQGTRKGDTTGREGNGVYVHTITSWTNQCANDAAGRKATDYKPDNTMRTSDDIANAEKWLNDLMQAQDVDPKYSTGHGDGGHAAQLNTGRTDNNGPATVTHDNPGKVGISTAKNPDYLEAYRMWNAQVTHDVVLKKNVTGNLGDLTKEFVFEVTLTGLERNQTYTTSVPAGKTDEDPAANTYVNDVTSAGIRMYGMTPASCLAADGRSFTTDGTGRVSFKVNLKDGDTLVLNSLPRSASYQIKEQASDHVAQYNIVSTNPGSENKAVFTETDHTPGGTDAEHLGKANPDAGTDLSTEVEYVDRYDGTVIITFRNNRDIATLTGVAGIDYMVYSAVLVLLAAGAAVIIRRRREYAEEDDFPA